MQVQILSGARGKTKTGKAWGRLTYIIQQDTPTKSVDRLGLKVAGSFINEDSLPAVWLSIKDCQFPFDASLDVTTTDGRSIEVSGVTVDGNGKASK